MTDTLILGAREKLNPDLIDFVIYHFPCHDGFTAAWCAWRYLKRVVDIESVTFHGARHGDSPPDVDGKNVLIVDFSYDRETLIELNEKANNLIVLDHHVSAQKALENLDFAFFDMNRSGAGLAWDYFFTEERPRLINFVEDRDIWRWTHEGSEEFMIAFMELVPTRFEEYEQFLEDENVDGMIKNGRVLRTYVQNKVKRLSEKAGDAVFLGYKIKIVNSMDYISDIGNHLSEDCDFVLIWYHDSPNNRFPVSLRSNGDVDVSEVAKKFGGGGHKAAAGFLVQENVLELIDKNT